jgi:transglutaminase-like putative cysteine protease
MVYSTSEVLTPEQLTDPRAELSPLDDYSYRTPTAYTPGNGIVCQFAEPHRHDGDLATAMAVMDAVHTQLKYEPGATDVKTTAGDVLALGRGVCQDFAHVMIGACRCLGIAARYISGYLHDPQAERRDGASHAWVDIYARGDGWVSLDPTHNRQQTEHYVRLAVGRDYADVPPTRGVFKGNARETLEVQVSVQAL